MVRLIKQLVNGLLSVNLWYWAIGIMYLRFPLAHGHFHENWRHRTSELIAHADTATLPVS